MRTTASSVDPASENALRDMLESGKLHGELVAGKIVISDGTVKTYGARGVIAAVPHTKYDGIRKKWRCPATRTLRAALQHTQEQRRRAVEEEARQEAERASNIEQVIERRIERIKRCVSACGQRMSHDLEFNRRDYEYGQSLLTLDAPLGSDGAPNWPDPPGLVV